MNEQHKARALAYEHLAGTSDAYEVLYGICRLLLGLVYRCGDGWEALPDLFLRDLGADDPATYHVTRDEAGAALAALYERQGSEEQP